MDIMPAPPFALSKEPDGTSHAVKDEIQVSVLPDVGEFEINHRVGEKPSTGQQSRWLHIFMKDKGLHVFVSGTHVVVSERDLNPTFELDKGDWLEKAIKAMKAEKDEKGRYVVDCDRNRQILSEAFDKVTECERNKFMSFARYAFNKVVDGVR